MDNVFTKSDEEMIKIFSDPVKWAEYHLGDKPRWYQQEILRHPHNRKVLRCGRRVGKCIEEKQRILDPTTGAYREVGELARKDMHPNLLTMNDQYKLVNGQSMQIVDNGKKDTFIVRTKTGREVRLTKDHPVLTIEEWKEVQLLGENDKIAVPRTLPYFGSKEKDKNELKFIACLISGAEEKQGWVSYHSTKTPIFEEFILLAKKMGYDTIRDRTKKQVVFITTPLDYELIDYFSEEGLPSFVFELEKESLRTFLSYMIASKGYVSAGSDGGIVFGSSKDKLVRDIKHLLLRFGIQSHLNQKVYKDQFTYAELKIRSKQDIITFIKEIGLPYDKEVQKKLLEETERKKEREETLPIELWSHIEEKRKEKNMTRKEMGRDCRVRPERPPTISSVQTYAETLEDSFLYDVSHSNLMWEEVAEVIPIGERQTYDVMVPETHNLVVEDILVHNTWTMVAHMLWIAFTNNQGREFEKGATCVVATPFDNQARLIFDELNTFIANSDILSNSVKSITKNPYYIEFKNKAKIKLFTAGTKSGSEGGSLRGQKASYLYLDEPPIVKLEKLKQFKSSLS